MWTYLQNHTDEGNVTFNDKAFNGNEFGLVAMSNVWARERPMTSSRLLHSMTISALGSPVAFISLSLSRRNCL